MGVTLMPLCRRCFRLGRPHLRGAGGAQLREEKASRSLIGLSERVLVEAVPL